MLVTPLISQSLISIKRPLVTFGVRMVQKFTKLYIFFGAKDDEATVEWQDRRYRLAELMRYLVDGFLVLFTILGLVFVALWLCFLGGRPFSKP